MANLLFNPEESKEGTYGGFRYVEHQHNGYLYVKLVGKWLYKRVLTKTGNIMNYKPAIANEFERRSYN